MHRWARSLTLFIMKERGREKGGRSFAFFLYRTTSLTCHFTGDLEGFFSLLLGFVCLTFEFERSPSMPLVSTTKKKEDIYIIQQSLLRTSSPRGPINIVNNKSLEINTARYDQGKKKKSRMIWRACQMHDGQDDVRRITWESYKKTRQYEREGIAERQHPPLYRESNKRKDLFIFFAALVLLGSFPMT